jgi:hypothetical protein
MVRKVVVEPAWSDGPRSDEGERRERVRVVERGDLGDHPADADARQVRRSVVAGTASIGQRMAPHTPRCSKISASRRSPAEPSPTLFRSARSRRH